MQTGCLHIYTGNGKGKTTASLGLICRALGHSRKVCLIQFMKKNFTYGEIQFLQKQENIDIFQFGTAELIDPAAPAEIDFSEAKAALKKAESVLQEKKYDLIVIDEINVALYFKLVPLPEVVELAKHAKQQRLKSCLPAVTQHRNLLK